MPIVVKRPNLTWKEKLYFPVILGGIVITTRHFVKTFFDIWFRKKKKVTMEYPEEKWSVPAGYRGAPTLVSDQDGREKCVGCQLCEFVCPPRAITIKPGEIQTGDRKKIEKYAESFDINMLRCIYCGLCEEVCPEQAIFLKQDYAFVGSSRKDLVHDKKKLLELGGIRQDSIMKWKNK